MLKEKIKDLMERSNFMTLSTSVAGNASAANVYFSNNGLDIYFLPLIHQERRFKLHLTQKSNA